MQESEKLVATYRKQSVDLELILVCVMYIITILVLHTQFSYFTFPGYNQACHYLQYRNYALFVMVELKSST